MMTVQNLYIFYNSMEVLLKKKIVIAFCVV